MDFSIDPESDGMALTPEIIRQRTKRLALDVIRFLDALPPSRAGDVLSRQLIRSATSVGANYRAACRARSKPEFVAKLGIVEEEADETIYWLELIAESGLHPNSGELERLAQEANEIVAIVVASIRTAKANRP